MALVLPRDAEKTPPIPGCFRKSKTLREKNAVKVLLLYFTLKKVDLKFTLTLVKFCNFPR